MAPAVQQASDQLLAGSGLAFEEDGGPSGGNSMHKENHDRALRTYRDEADVGEGALGELLYKFGLAKKLFGFALGIGRLGQSCDAAGELVFVEFRRKIDDPRVCRCRRLARIEPDQKHADVRIQGT